MYLTSFAQYFYAILTATISDRSHNVVGNTQSEIET